MTSRKPQLLPTSCGNGSYSHCIPVSASCPLTSDFCTLMSGTRTYAAPRIGRATPQAPWVVPSHLVHIHFGGIGGKKIREREQHLSSLNFLCWDSHYHILRQSYYSFPSSSPHTSSPGEWGANCKINKQQMRFLKLLANPESMVWPTLFLVLWSPPAALIQLAKSNVTTYYIRSIIACPVFKTNKQTNKHDFAMIRATSHRVHGAALYQLISWGCKSGKNSYCRKFPFTFIHW